MGEDVGQAGLTTDGWGWRGSWLQGPGAELGFSLVGGGWEGRSGRGGVGLDVTLGVRREGWHSGSQAQGRSGPPACLYIELPS